MNRVYPRDQGQEVFLRMNPKRLCTWARDQFECNPEIHPAEALRDVVLISVTPHIFDE